jgi:membrane associated rhomboid family serine protease
MLAFLFAASNFEGRVGTFQFLYIFGLSGSIIASLYVMIIWIVSWISPALGTAGICGLNIPFFFILTTESFSNTGLVETFA